MREYYPRNRNSYHDEFKDDLLDTADKLSKNGKHIVGGSLGGGATTNIQDNNLTDINITINLNIGDKVNPETLDQLSGILKQIQNIQNPSTTKDETIKKKWFNSDG